eukprot:jgi/Bigna1/126743/aug1.3_g1451
MEPENENIWRKILQLIKAEDSKIGGFGSQHIRAGKVITLSSDTFIGGTGALVLQNSSIKTEEGLPTLTLNITVGTFNMTEGSTLNASTVIVRSAGIVFIDKNSIIRSIYSKYPTTSPGAAPKDFEGGGGHGGGGAPSCYAHMRVGHSFGNPLVTSELFPGGPGSGSFDQPGGYGGGIIHIEAVSSDIYLRGLLDASGSGGGTTPVISIPGLRCGGGAGGTVLLEANQIFGDGTVIACGGKGLNGGGGGGGGVLQIDAAKFDDDLNFDTHGGSSPPCSINGGSGVLFFAKQKMLNCSGSQGLDYNDVAPTTWEWLGSDSMRAPNVEGGGGEEGFDSFIGGGAVGSPLGSFVGETIVPLDYLTLTDGCYVDW